MQYLVSNQGMEQAFQPLPFCRSREDALPQCCPVQAAVWFQYLLTKMPGDDLQCRGTWLHHYPRHHIRVDDIDTQ